MSSETKGAEFWQNCPPPKVIYNIRFEEGVAYGTDHAGVEYRRAKTFKSLDKPRELVFVWQRKMWRMG